MFVITNHAVSFTFITCIREGFESGLAVSVTKIPLNLLRFKNWQRLKGLKLQALLVLKFENQV